MGKTSLLYAFLGGALVGGAMGVLFAPAKGTDVRRKIKKCIRRKCAGCTDDQIDEIVEQLRSEFGD